ncbi:glycosyltransferase [Klebsiella huaxiensis]|uniref:Glycosyltransferase n=1 Tax=Klebsiella huaxiensis TaxID=2153354 RepID=A0ABT6EIU2_9ENTR|nr:glycosyltransferase [Klebsiella huaxiensis]MDG1644313.1 glycosyltransferase [Klebsiella huaxiensis]
MKILFFCLKFPLASETFVLNQINYFISLGHDVKVLSLYPGDMKNVHEDYYKFDLSRRVNYIFENEYNKRSLTFYSRARLILSNVFKFNLKSFNFKKYGFFVCSLLLPSIVSKLKNRMSSDVIVAHFGHSGALANYLRDVGVISGQLVTVFHGYDLSAETLLKKYNFAYKDLFLSGDLFLPISEKWKDKLIEMQCPPDKIHIIRMGIKVKHFEYNERSFSAEPIKIISVCRLIEKKGLEYAIVACANLKKLGYKFSYQIIGYGELHEQLSLLINKLGKVRTSP